METDTIAAISTPCVSGALGIVRLSGKDAIKITAKIFQPKNKVDILSAKSHTVHFGYINDESEIIDEVLATIMRAPQTYTREDVVEISAHGNPLILRKIVEIVMKNGARLAEPGEFTKRAFLNGRLDLSQAEAVCDIINARTEAAEKTALKNLEGNLSKKIHLMQDILREILIKMEMNIDFSEDNTTEVEHKSLKKALSALQVEIAMFLESYNKGKIEKDGINVPIIGNANSGKSSLFNILVDIPERALVTHIPGTTRDNIDESVNLSGRLFKITDTAGFKNPKGLVERKSLERTHECIENGDILLVLIDSSKALNKNVLNFISSHADRKIVVVLNKIDLPRKLNAKNLKNIFAGRSIAELSCKENKGIDELKAMLVKESDSFVRQDKGFDIVLNNVRHKEALQKSQSNINEALNAIESNLSQEFVATDIRRALESLQEITGENVTESLLEDIFSRFCIGK